MKQTRRTFLQWLLGLSQLNVLLGFFNQGKLRAETPATKSAIDAGKGEVRFPMAQADSAETESGYLGPASIF
ncbi:MAG: hypothetical protein WB696_31435 [Chthoniobacterales bacterium]